MVSIKIVKFSFKRSAKRFDCIYEYAILSSDPETLHHGNPGMRCVLVREAIPGRKEKMLWRRKLKKIRRRKQVRIAK